MAESTQHASWDAWGDIVPDHVRIRKIQRRSRYAAQQDANSDIPCCVRFAVPRDGGPEYKVVNGMRDRAETKVTRRQEARDTHEHIMFLPLQRGVEDGYQ